jgi:arginyl-tRNA synthetase
VERSKREFERIYGILGIAHESDAGESFYEDKMKPVIELLRQKGLLARGKKQEKAEEDAIDEAAADARAREMAIEAARDAKRKQDMSEEELIANAPRIGTAAVKFFDLKNGRTRDIELPQNADMSINLDRVLATDGETGPYVQMAYARCAGILRKAGFDPLPEGVDFALLDEPETREVVRVLGEHPAKVRAALADHEPSLVARHLLDAAHALGTFYNKHKVLDAPDDVKRARALLVLCAKKVIGQCLDLLGIEALEKM